MLDWEKVIMGLRFCSEQGEPSEDCRRCPYQGEEYCTDAVMRDAMELLKEQEPVEHYGGVMRFTEATTYGEMFTQICETMRKAGILKLMPISPDRMSWEWEIRAVKWDD